MSRGVDYTFFSNYIWFLFKNLSRKESILPLDKFFCKSGNRPKTTLLPFESVQLLSVRLPFRSVILRLRIPALRARMLRSE